MKSIFLDGVVLKDIVVGGTFARKVHAWPKQIANGTSEFAVGEGLATANGDTHMQGEGCKVKNSPLGMVTYTARGIASLTGEFPPRRLRARRQAM